MSKSTASATEDLSSSRWISMITYTSLAIVSGFGLLGKLQVLRRVIHLPVNILTPVVLAWICLPLLWKLALRFRFFLAPAVIVGILVSSLVIFPRMADLQKTGRGTDQPDCVIVAAKALAVHSWPYDHMRMWSRTPMSCGPGWVAMQTPAVVLMSYRWNLLALWTLAVLLMRTRLQTHAIAGFLSLLGLAVATWVTACDGTDFLPFGLLVSGIMVALDSRSRYDVATLILLIFVAQFRFPMLIIPILLLPAWRIRQAICVSVIGFSCYIGFLLWHPSLFVSDGPLHLFSKLIGAHMLSGARWTAMLEVSMIFAVSLAAAIVARLLLSSRWLALAYLLVLAGGPAIVDLHSKYRVYGSISSAFGIWEGVSWLGGCLPMAALYLLSGTREISFEGSVSEPIHSV